MKQRSVPWYVFGLANLIVVVGFALGFWYLLIDPHTSLVASYAEPFDELLFWAILMVVFFGFNLEFHGFERMPQPLRGLVLIGVIVGLTFGITYLFEGWGHFNPEFSSGVKMGNGFFAAALYVLFGFYTYLTVVINWDHWPWRHLGLSQPWLGIAEIGTVTGPTVVLYALFGSPNLAVWTKPMRNLLDVPTTIGVVYSIILAVIITGLLTENWPWRLAAAGGETEVSRGGRQALASLIGNIAVGIGIYFVFRVLVGAIMGHTFRLLSVNGNEYPAELGVCWSFWMIIWANAFDNRPTGFSMGVNYAVRIAVTLGLAVGTFILYSYVLAPHILGEPVVAGHVYGNALGWMDWLILWILFYVVCLGSFGIPGLPEVSADEPEAMEEILEEREAAVPRAAVHD